MKKLFALILTAILCLCCLTSCGSAHKENTWFSEEKLTNCLVGDLPKIEKDYVNHNDEDIYVSFTAGERESYVGEVFEYLKTQNFKYFGTRGEQVSTLAGSFTTYYFKPATELSEFYVGSSYKFVYSDGTLDDGGDPIFCIITIYDYEAKNLEYGTKNFAYNTLISLRYKQEAPLSGRYALNEEEHEHTYEYNHDEIGHGWSYTCGCMTPPNFAQHFDGNGDGKCDEDSCRYEMSEFDMDKSIEKLKEKGLTEGMCYITEEECERATSLTNSEIAFMGGDFTVEIVKQYGLIENGDHSKSCTFITFATEEQATNFAELNIEYFAKGENSNNWKIARDGCVVVMTNLDVAFDIINLEFK